MDLFYACCDHPRRVFGGLCDCAKYGHNQSSNFECMQILIFYTLCLKMPVHAPKIGVLGGFYPQNGEQYEQDPQKAHPWAGTRRMMYISSKSVHFCGLGASRSLKQKAKKITDIHKKPQHVLFHVFAQTTHVVAAPRGFACVGVPATRLYIPSFIEIRSRVSEPKGVKIWPF